MAEKGTQDPTGTESDISKAQSQQQPPEQAKQQPETGERGEFETGQAEQAETGQDDQPDQALQGETATQQRTDVEGASLQSEKGEAESGFVGSKGEEDTSGEFVEKEEGEEDRKGDGE